jgi:predicted amidophosphoribosyltransferase
MPIDETLNLSDRLYDNHSNENGLFKHQVDAYPIASLFRYHGLLRKILLDFKVRGQWQSGMTLVDVFAADEYVQRWVCEADIIMAAPSSFWGRWHGKHDLAFALAERLSFVTGVPLLRAPSHTFFRFKKQSFLTRNERVEQTVTGERPHEENRILELRNEEIRDTKLGGFDQPFIVLVDDVVTSGKTLRALAQTMPLGRYRFLTLATAYRGRP